MEKETALICVPTESQITHSYPRAEIISSLLH